MVEAVFVYGTLLLPEVMEAVTGRGAPGAARGLRAAQARRP